MISAPAVGALWILASCAFSAVFEVYLGSLVQSLDPIAVNTACCGLIGLTHLVYELARDAKGFVAKVRASWPSLLLFNVTTAMTFTAILLSFRFLEPSVSKALLASVGPVLTIVIGPWVVKGLKIDSRKALAVAGTVLSAVALIWGRSPVGVLAAVLAGLGVVLSTLLMKRFEPLGWSISELLAGRLVLPALAGLLFWPKAGAAGAPGVGDWAPLLGVAVGWIWVPVFTFQWGLKKSDPVTAALIIAASPVLTLAFQAFDSRLVFNAVTVGAVSLNAAAAVFGQIPRVGRDTVFNTAETSLK